MMTPKQKWEYQISRISIRQDYDFDKIDSELVAWLNHLGDDGWEVMKITNFGMEYCVTLKRLQL